MWPAIEIINVGQAGFEAMLYTPNVRGLVWMLIQHRDVFKNETIRSITVSATLSDSLRGVLTAGCSGVC